MPESQRAVGNVGLAGSSREGRALLLTCNGARLFSCHDIEVLLKNGLANLPVLQARSVCFCMTSSYAGRVAQHLKAGVGTECWMAGRRRQDKSELARRLAGPCPDKRRPCDVQQGMAGDPLMCSVTCHAVVWLNDRWLWGMNLGLGRAIPLDGTCH